MTIPSGIKSLCVGLPRDKEDYTDGGKMVVDTLGRMGVRAELVRDGDPRALSADGLILFGSCAGFVQYPRLLARHAEARPVTAVWQIEPLPPPGLSAEAEEVGIRLARRYWDNLPGLYRRLTRLIPFRSTVREFARRSLTARLKAGMPEEHRGIHPRQLHQAMLGWYWFKTQYDPRWCDVVFASAPARSRFLTDRGIPCGYAPLGYHRGWGEDLALERDIDVLFLGHIRKTSRTDTIETLRRALEERNIRLVTIDRNCYGPERTRLLNRTRIVIDLVKVPWELPVMRLQMCISCGALVISTWPHEPVPFTRDQIVQAPIEAIPDRVQHYLTHEDERRRIVEAGRRFITTELTMENMVGRILTAMNNAAGRPPASRRLSSLGLNGLLD